MQHEPDLKPAAALQSQPSTWILGGLSLAAILLVGITGGRSSPLDSLLYLPMLLAAVGLRPRWIVPFGFGLACIYFALPGGSDPGPRVSLGDLARAGTFLLMALGGVFYAEQVQRERNRWNQAVEQQEALLNVTQVVNSCSKLEYALNSTLLLLKTVLPATRAASVYLQDEGGQGLLREAEIGPSDFRERVQPADLPAGWTLASQEPAVTQGQGGTPRAWVSLRSLDVPVGLLCVDLDGGAPPSRDQLRLLRGFAERVAFPLQKIRTQEGLQSLAYTDSMTGLHNYRAFRSNLEDEWKRSSRYRRPLSVILLDLDGFKAINDRYGHPAGDRLLAGVAAILRDTVRETDIPARYGGEEFAVVCPETSEDDAEVVAERIRIAVEKARFQIVDDESTAVTCSLGLATYPTNANSEEALIDAADAALYYAKRSGKNTVRSAESLPFLTSDTGT